MVAMRAVRAGAGGGTSTSGSCANEACTALCHIAAATAASPSPRADSVSGSLSTRTVFVGATTPVRQLRTVNRATPYARSVSCAKPGSRIARSNVASTAYAACALLQRASSGSAVPSSTETRRALR